MVTVTMSAARWTPREGHLDWLDEPPLRAAPRMSRSGSTGEIDRFYASLSRGARFKLYAGVFFLFAPVGLLSSLRFDDHRSPWIIAAHLALSGLPRWAGPRRSSMTSGCCTS